MIDTKTALVLFSGGQDSTVCLAWALENYEKVETIGFDYRQRHAVELTQRSVIIDKIKTSFPKWGEKLGDDHVLDLGILGEVSETALTRDTQIAMAQNGLPTTFVPGRNLIFLNFAAIVAYRRGLGTLIGGMCETDYSGYPDCREATIASFQTALNLGMNVDFKIETPLMHLDKAQTWALANTLGGDAMIDITVEDTHTCYQGDRTTRHGWGYGCGQCPACELRANGYKSWQASQ